MKEKLQEFQKYFRAESNVMNGEQEVIDYFTNPDNLTQRQTLKELYQHFFNKSLKGCKNCLVDAFFELLYYNTNSIIEGEYNGRGILRGVILEDYKVEGEEKKPFITFGKTTPELLEYYWENYPEYRVYYK